MSHCLSHKIVKTRKDHHCWGCTRKFLSGNKMTVTTFVDCGEISSAYWCEECSDFMETLESWEREEGFGYGDLLNYDELREKIFPQGTEVSA